MLVHHFVQPQINYLVSIILINATTSKTHPLVFFQTSHISVFPVCRRFFLFFFPVFLNSFLLSLSLFLSLAIFFTGLF